MATKFKYTVEGQIEQIKSRLGEILTKEINKPYVKTSWKDKELIIKIEKAGTSEINILLSEQGNNCLIEESKRSIAFMHKPFIGEVESIVDNLLTNKLGAKRV
jgi:hypothetical protein